MKILILGAGKMGAFFADVLSDVHEVAIFEVDKEKLKFTYNVIRMNRLQEIRLFNPDLVINAVTLKYTLEAFNAVLPYLSAHCILSDIASVKTGLLEFYQQVQHPFVSSHPMFGPTFADLRNLSTQSAIVISESDKEGKEFFLHLYKKLRLQIFEYSFEKHDKTMAYSLSIPFASTLVFAAVMEHQDAPGTTFKKHLNIARGLLSEDDYLLSEILFNPYAPIQLERIRERLESLLSIIQAKDADRMREYLHGVRKNID